MHHVRIDKWLWAARFFKTRSAATEAVLGGRVQLNGTRVKPAREVRVADTLEIRRGLTQWTVVVAVLAERRGSAEVAAGLYDETPDRSPRGSNASSSGGSPVLSERISAAGRRSRTGAGWTRSAARSASASS